jgi:hypothetical protein
MPLRFQRHVTLIPGLRANFSKSGVSLSIGHRGFWYTMSANGRRRATVGLPGTGLFYTHVEHIPPAPAIHPTHRASFVLAILALVVLIFAAIGALVGR